MSESVVVKACGGGASHAGCCAHAPVLIAPSMLSCDFAEMAKEAQRMVDAGSDWLHLDVMVRQQNVARGFRIEMSPFVLL